MTRMEQLEVLKFIFAVMADERDLTMKARLRLARAAATMLPKEMVEPLGLDAGEGKDE